MRRFEFYRVKRGANLADPAFWNQRLEDLDLRIHQIELYGTQISAAIDQGLMRFGGIDMAVLNAGIFGASHRIAELPMEEWRRVIAVNLDSVFYGCRAVIPYLKARGGGAIVNTASASGMAMSG